MPGRCVVAKLVHKEEGFGSKILITAVVVGNGDSLLDLYHKTVSHGLLVERHSHKWVAYLSRIHLSPRVLRGL